MTSQGSSKTASQATSQTTTNDKQTDKKNETSPTTPTSRDLGHDPVTPTRKKGKMVTVYVLIADHPHKKKPLPLTIDITQPAHIVIREISTLTRIPLDRLSVEYGGWFFPLEGFKRSCRMNYVCEGTIFLASKLKKDGLYVGLLKDAAN
ncbi:Hypothetical protein NocV09_02600030 [Nannochloropsis oceanica]